MQLDERTQDRVHNLTATTNTAVAVVPLSFARPCLRASTVISTARGPSTGFWRPPDRIFVIQTISRAFGRAGRRGSGCIPVLRPEALHQNVESDGKQYCNAHNEECHHRHGSPRSRLDACFGMQGHVYCPEHRRNKELTRIYRLRFESHCHGKLD